MAGKSVSAASARPAAKKAGAKKSAAKKTTPAKSTSKRAAKKSVAPARKVAAKKAPAKKTTAKPTAKKTTKKTAARQPAGKKAPAKKAPAKKATGRVPAHRLPQPAKASGYSKQEFATIRERLASEIASLLIEVEQAESDIASRFRDGTDGAGEDQADQGSKASEREHEISLANNARDLIIQNERAIERVDSGVYGVCESCGGPIGKARLKVFPRATLCVNCKQREERR